MPFWAAWRPLACPSCPPQVLRYLEAFASAFDLGQVVQTRTEVLAVRPLPAADRDDVAVAGDVLSPGGSSGAGGLRWEVTTRGLGSPAGAAAAAAGPAPGSSSGSGSSGGGEAAAARTSVYDAVVVCSGHFAEPRVPALPGQASFPGRQIHSHNYRTPEPFRGQTGGCRNGLWVGGCSCRRRRVGGWVGGCSGGSRRLGWGVSRHALLAVCGQDAGQCLGCTWPRVVYCRKERWPRKAPACAASS